MGKDIKKTKQTVPLALTVTVSMYDALEALRQEKELPTVQEVIRNMLSVGLEKHKGQQKVA